MRAGLRSGLVAAAVLLVAACGEQQTPGGQPSTTQPSVTASPATPAGPALPSGWRWESFMNVELAVPNSWGYGTTDSPWCIAKRPIQPYVGRPGAVAGVGCSVSHPKGSRMDPGLLAANGVFVWFSSVSSRVTPPPDGTQGDRLTLHQDGVQIEIQAPKQIRVQIAATVHVVEQDHNGCPVTHPISANPAWRPAPGAATKQFPDPVSVSACRYNLTGAVRHDWQEGPATLISSVQLTGQAATHAANAMNTALGGGPNAPGSCLADSAYGEEVIVVQIRYPSGDPREVVLRYSGCDHHGFDSGDTVRILTAASVAPFITGPNQVNSFSTELSAVLRPDDPVVTKS